MSEVSESVLQALAHWSLSPLDRTPMFPHITSTVDLRKQGPRVPYPVHWLRQASPSSSYSSSLPHGYRDDPPSPTLFLPRSHHRWTASLYDGQLE